MNFNPSPTPFAGLVEAYNKGQFASAVTGAKEFLSVHPDAAPVWKLLAAAQRQLGQSDLDALQHAARLLPDDEETLYTLGEACQRAGHLSEAAGYFQRILAKRPDQFGAWVNLGIVQTGMGALQAAEASYRRALVLDPRSAITQYNLALVLRSSGQFDAARSALVAALTLQPGFPEALRLLSGLLLDAGQFSEAEVRLRQWLKYQPEAVDALNQLTNLVLNAGRTAEGEGLLQERIRRQPEHPEAPFRLGWILVERGALLDAEGAFRNAIAVAPAFAEAHCALGTLLLRLGRLGESADAYATALRLKPQSPALHFQRGDMLRRLGREEEAVNDFMAAYAGRFDWRQRLTTLVDPWVKLDGLVIPPSDPVPDAPLLKSTDLAPQTLLFSPPGACPEASQRRSLRIVLIYPPPWQMGVDAGGPFAPPVDVAQRELDADFQTLPYGLLTLAAEARRAGHAVSVHNLSVTPWPEVIDLIDRSGADVFGLSAFTSNRRGLGAVAAALRKRHPAARIVAGGPFVTALPEHTLKHYREIDLAVVGEGESTFMELLERVADGMPITGLAGTAYRVGDATRLGPTRARIKDIDALASPFDYFDSHIVMTSRGCPSACSFCGSIAMWGRKLRFHSVDTSVALLRRALSRVPIPFLAIKDDTFTAHRRRALAICDGITAQKLDFLWSCDTRVDSLDEELLYRMRLAGCQRISLGVESGSPEILESIHKDTTPEAILKIAALARKYGIHVRFYMILGNRGESPSTVEQSIALIRQARPSFITFCLLGFCPGTEEWEHLRQRAGITPDIYFTNDFKELTVAQDRAAEWNNVLTQIQCEIGSFGFEYSVAERQAIVERLPTLHSAQVDLANACLRAGQLDAAEAALDRAEAWGFPMPAMIDNQRACIALTRSKPEQALALLDQAVARTPSRILTVNRQNLRRWLNDPKDRQHPPRLNDSVQAYEFQVIDHVAKTDPSAI